MRLALEKDPSNPNKIALASSVSSVASTKSKPNASVRPSVRDAIAAQRRAALQQNAPERPSSAQATFSSLEAPASSTRHPIRPAGAVRPPSGLSKPNDGNQAPSTNRTITAGPVRRPKRPEIKRPATADPYATRNAGPVNQTTPTISPHTSPSKIATASKASVASASRPNNNKTPARTPATMAPAIRGRRAETVSRPSPRQQAHARMNSMPVSPTPKEENMTLILPLQPDVEAGSPAEPVKPLNLGYRSRDSASTMASEDDTEGFTMVIPNLRHDSPEKKSPARPSSSGIPHKSTLPRRTPMKGATENIKPGSPLVKRYELPAKPQSPERSRLVDVADHSEAGAVQVYEDPFQADELSATPAGPVKPVLEEIVINERASDLEREQAAALNQSTRSNEQNIEATRTPRGHAKTTSTGSILGANSDSTDMQSSAEIMKSKRLLNSAIEKVRSKTLDAHGFRRVQELVKTNNDIWGEDAHKYGDLLIALLEYLEAPAESLRITGTPAGTKVQNLKTQVLATIRGMLAMHRREAGPYYARSLCSILSARRQFDDMSHIASEMEKTAEEISRTGPASDCLDAVLDLVDSLAHSSSSSIPSSPAASPDSPRPSSSDGSHASRTINMSLQTLASLLSALSARKQASSPAQTKRLGGLAVRLLQDSDPEIRRADMEFCLALHERLERDVFWKAVEGAKESGLNLITYYLARRGRA
jgi:CLIP-associating protein 1/2